MLKRFLVSSPSSHFPLYWRISALHSCPTLAFIFPDDIMMMSQLLPVYLNFTSILPEKIHSQLTPTITSRINKYFYPIALYFLLYLTSSLLSPSISLHFATCSCSIDQVTAFTKNSFPIIPNGKKHWEE